jgi:nucleoside-diphosphate-sugar epimerase
MKILVTGGAGFVGSVVSAHLLNAGEKVRILDSLLHGGQSLLSLYSSGAVEFVKGDVRESDKLKRALEGVDAVIHLAAIVGDPACAKQPELAKQVNQNASIEVFNQAKQAGVKRFIFASTCSNYGRMTDPSSYVDEGSELRPVSLYAETKVAVEKELLSHSVKLAPIVTIIRLATVFGISPRMRFDLTVNEFSMEMALNKKVIIFGPQFWRPYIHVKDVARAISLILQSPAEKVAGEVFNVGDTGQNFQKVQIVNLIKSRTPDAVVELVEKNEDPRDYRVSFEKIQKKLGFKISRTVEDGVEEVVKASLSGVFGDVHQSSYRN